MDPTRRAIELGTQLGFDLIGVCRAQRSERETFIRQWLADGKHGSMDYLARNLETRLDPAMLLPGAKTIIVAADRYESAASHEPQVTRGRVARYAWGDDYHKTIRKRLHKLADALASEHPGHQFRTTVDTAPILEREHAVRAGLGWIGKHTLTIHPHPRNGPRNGGSYLLLGTIVTTLEMTPRDQPMPDHCGACTRCIDACPTRCIAPEGYSLDASRCISYLTIEHRGPIAPDLQPMMGDWIAGCDVCQEVCPFNQKADPRNGGGQRAENRGKSFDLLAVLGWSENDRRAAFQRSALKRIKLDMMKRNALIAAGNLLKKLATPSSERSEGPAPATWNHLKQRITQIADDETECELVRLTAKQVLARLSRSVLPDEP
ncbi:MAG: tRNA epoxyqueuosine(34) reductase QueG [Phycisphaeraceae bacterium]|nr:tRNA epoxyqueuosine(34) reductase QueG [Phycisphaeraceae bacterium]